MIFRLPDRKAATGGCGWSLTASRQHITPPCPDYTYAQGLVGATPEREELLQHESIFSCELVLVDAVVCPLPLDLFRQWVDSFGY